jgi:protein tyrosine/serine phosphatase
MSTLNTNNLSNLKDYLALYLVDHGFVRAIYPNLYSIDNRMYRSSQPSPKQLKVLKKKYGFKTIINLRGENGLSAYKLEKEACARLDLDLINFRAYSRNPPEFHEVQTLITLFNKIKYPALMHCKSGSDRTGVVATLYRILHLNESVEQSLKNELHWKYGHIKSSNTGVLDYFFNQYLSENKVKPKAFLDWVENYDHVSLKHRFRSSGWTSFIIDKILRRE